MAELVNENEIKTLINKIKNLSPKEKTHILSILKKHSIEFTKNSNGYFFNLNKINAGVMEQLSKCVELIEKNRNLLVVLDKKRNEQLDYYRDLIQTKINKTIDIKRSEYIQKFFVEDDPDRDLKYFISKKVKKLTKSNSDADIELLMKQRMNATKYKKDSIYYKILQACTRKARVSSKTGDDEGNSTFFSADETGDFEVDFGGEYDLSDEYYNNEDADVDAEADADADAEAEGEADADADGNDLDANDENEVDGNEGNELYRDETEMKKDDLEENEFSEDKFEYFKRLLKNEHGYTFDYDKDVRMECEEYIA
jgi:hypothetical protein